MPPSLALLLWLILAVGLLRFDPAKVPGISLALWVPLVQVLILASRLPSQWLGGASEGFAAQAFEDGSPLDRTISLSLILLSAGILAARSFKWGTFFAANRALLAFLAFALISVMWSDFPFVAFKRWVRDLGPYAVILVILTERRPSEAFRTVFRRLFFLLIPLNIVLDKYFPGLSKQYDVWSGAASYVGATTSKNMLGLVCMVSGLFFFWDALTRWSDRKEWRTKQIILLDTLYLWMTLSLLNDAHSATSNVCLAFGCLVVAWAHIKPAMVRRLLPVVVCLAVGLIYGFGTEITGHVATAVGRDPTLTDRTAIWSTLLSLKTNPVIGTGYESFWLGDRLQYIWRAGFLINEAHNGYLSVYLNLGVIGLSLLLAFLFSSYSKISTRLTLPSSHGSLAIAVWTVLLVYNVTEAAFQGGLLWMMLLPAALMFDQPRDEVVTNASGMNCRVSAPVRPVRLQPKPVRPFRLPPKPARFVRPQPKRTR